MSLSRRWGAYLMDLDIPFSVKRLLQSTGVMGEAKGLAKHPAVAVLWRLIGWQRPPTVPIARQRLRVVGPYRPLDPVVAAEAMRALHGTGTAVLLEIRATAERVEASVICDARQAVEMERALRGVTPEWAIETSSLTVAGMNLSTPLRLVGIMGSATRSDCIPVRDVQSFGDADPLSALLEAVQPLGEGEGLLIRYLVRPASSARRARARRELARWSDSAQTPSGLRAILSGATPSIPRFASDPQRKLEERLAQPAFEVIGAVELVGRDAARLASRGRSIASTFASGFDCGLGGIPTGSWQCRRESQNVPAVRRDGVAALFLTAGELASLWHPLSSHVFVPGAVYERRSTRPLPLAVVHAQGMVLGVHRQRGRELPVRVPRPDLDAGHLDVIGRTGVGKSTLIHQLVRQLAAEPDRPSVAVIDPNNDLARDICLCSIPRVREADVVFLEMGDTEFPVGLPLFRSPPGVQREALVQTTFSVIRLIFREHWSPTRMEDAVFALTATLCRLQGATLMDVPRLFGDASFRGQATAGMDDPVALEFWRDYENLSEAGRRELARPVLYRLRAFYRSPAVRNIVCQPRGIDFDKLMERGSILLVSLAGSAIQAEADLLGELIIARLHLSALARLERRREARKRFYLAVDESQRFRGASLPILLSEGRKLGLSLILSTQYLGALGEGLAASVLGNVGTLVAFRCGPADSRLLGTSLRPFTAEQLEDLDRYEAVAKLQIDGSTMPAFDFTTLPVGAPPDEAMLSYVRSHSRQLYAQPRREVEERLATEAPYRPRGTKGYDVDEE